jgi:peptide/nickel transport system ATP-binding protein
MEQVRGARIGMVFQDPLTSLNSALSIGGQIAETLQAHRPTSRAQAERKAIELLARVGVANPEQRIHDFPHHFSGGMRQRVLIAAAISCSPNVIIADEPTTALDVTVQAKILRLLHDLQRDMGAALLLITHDLGIVAAMADEVLVMYAGRIVERAVARRSSRSAAARLTSEIHRQAVALRRGAHPRRTSAGDRTRRSALSPLIMRLPACWWKQSCHLSDLLLQVESLAKPFRTRGAKGASVKAVAGVSFTLRRGETLGLVGESGCGKSTLSRLILSLLDPDAGKVSIDEIDFTNSSGRAKREMRRRIQIAFQDALSSLNPRMTVGTNIAEPMKLQGLGSAASRRAEAQRLLGVVGLRPEHEDRYPQ